MTKTVDNPYIGPRTFEEKDKEFFFGRDKEARDLLGSVIAEPLLLFYAPSGAGKSSLINTKLIPGLRQERFIVSPILPVGRVSGHLPEGIIEVANIFAFNLLLSLDKSQKAEHLTHMTLTTYLQAHKSKLATVDGEDDNHEPARVLIIDQFEEIVTTHPDRWSEREGFFQQLKKAMADDPFLWVVLAMREDYIAALEPYARLLLGRLRVRYRMAQLSNQAALAAVKKPAEQGGRPFAPGVAESLVDNLRQIRVQAESPSMQYPLVSANVDASSGDQPAANGGRWLGQFVEPVQLQVVCYQLWENLKERPSGEITQADLDELGNVNLALAQFYEQALAKARKETGVSEIFLRQWFERKLITEAGTRGTVYHGSEKTEGLANQTVEVLVNQYLLRAEIRSGGTWYELAHDRLIEPILQANRDWWLQQSPLVQAAQAWEDSGRDKTKLYQDQQLKDTLANVDREALEPLVEQFLIASEEAERVRMARHKREQRLVLAILGLILGGLIAWSWFQSQQAQKEATAARAAEATTLATQIRAESRQLTGQALAYLDSQLDLALLLSLEANRITETVEARGSLLASLEHNPRLTTFLHDHTDAVNSVTFSPVDNGHILASASADHTIILWDVTTTPAVSRTLTLSAAVNSVAFNQEGQILASGSIDNLVMLWNVVSGQPLGQPLTGHTAAVNSVAFSPDGQTLASASDDGTIILWKVAPNPSSSRTLPHTAAVDSVAFSPDGQTLAAGSLEGLVTLWDVNTGQSIGQPFTGHIAPVKSVTFSPDGQILVSASDDGTLILWDVATRQQRGQPLIGHTAPVNSVAFSPTGRTLASGGADNTVRLWNVSTGQPIDQPFTGYMAAVNSVAFSPNGQTLASSNSDGTIILWAVTAGPRLGQVLTGHTNWVNDVAFSPDGQTLASASFDKTIRLWDVATTQALSPIRTGHTEAVSGVAFSPADTPQGTGGQILASGSQDGTIILWDVAKDSPTGSSLTGRTAAINRVAFSPDGKMLVSANNDGTILRWDVSTRLPLDPPLTGYVGAVNSVAFSPEGETLASGSQDGKIILWDVSTGQPIGTPFTGHELPIFSVAFTPDGQMLASGSSDGTILLWNVAAHQRLDYPLIGHTAPVFSLAFSPATPQGSAQPPGQQGALASPGQSASPPLGDFVGSGTGGQMLAFGGEDGAIILWDVAARQRFGSPLIGHAEQVNSVAFSPDGRILASGSADGTIILWDVSFEAWRGRACRLANRNLTWEEWTRFFPKEMYHKTCLDQPIHPSFIEEGRDLARIGDVDAAVAQFQRALELDSTSLDFDPETEAQQLAVQGLVEQGRQLAAGGDVEGALAQFHRALELDPNVDLDPADTDLDLDPEVAARQFAAQGMIEKGGALAVAGDVEGALVQYQQALELDPNLDLDPEVAARQLAAQGWLERGASLAQQGQVDEAVDAYEQAQKLDPTLEIDAASWDVLCRFGSLAGEAKKVMVYCERAVELTPDDGWIRHDRGVARALTEDFTGAIEDFNFFVDWSKENDLDEQIVAKREDWIAELEEGRNPFDAATLEELRNE